MRAISQLASMCVVIAALASCSIDKATFMPIEDCEATGDEDRNGLADCDDPVCAAATACQPVCGNGKVEADERCDDSDQVNDDGCDSNCTPTGCGNGIVAGAEVCDDGNKIDDDGCDSNCTITACGNGIVTGAEECDDGNSSNEDACVNSCEAARCGDGFRQVGVEECDDGNLRRCDGCNTSCVIEVVC